MINQNYNEIENLLLDLLNLVARIFSKNEIQEVQDFIDVGEYGLALETFVDIICEEQKQTSKNTLDLIYKLARIMAIDETALKKKLEETQI